MTDRELMQQALEALELAQDNLRDHGDNCFLHDEGEYNRCFCGKDSLSNHLQSVVEKLDEALAEQPAQQQELPACLSCGAAPTRYVDEGTDFPGTYCDTCGPGGVPAQQEPDYKGLYEKQFSNTTIWPN